MTIEDPRFDIGASIRLIGTNHTGTVISGHYNFTRLICFWSYKIALERSGVMVEWIETDCEKIE